MANLGRVAYVKRIMYHYMKNIVVYDANSTLYINPSQGT